MAVTNIARSLRDGELVIKDGTTPTPQSLALQIDEGDLTWTVQSRTLEIRDRGSLSAGHTRKGGDEPISLSFSARWTQLTGKSVSTSALIQGLSYLLTVNSVEDVAGNAIAPNTQTLFTYSTEVAAAVAPRV